jgi:hypothetical protein
VDDCCELIGRFPDLTHLGGFVVTQWFRPIPQWCDEILEHMAGAAPKLRFVEIVRGPTKRDRRWVVLERDEAGVFTYHRVVRDLKGIRIEDWGGWYFGALEDQPDLMEHNLA